MYYMRTLRLLNLHCNNTHDENNSSKLDKTFLTVDNGRFYVFGPESLMYGSDWKINTDVQFNKQAQISFFDEDLVKNLSTTKHFRNYITISCYLFIYQIILKSRTIKKESHNV